eukprot:TRINITY_DN2169_c0_g1_i1.p1 TRINITY_DN2169_c0_g1~~TRINITY_DN2169_c0_g1_i1.p1  ORF type:complete len:170 (-),score=27.07 TRINITY_DN2169_c0_g1_i1:129-638(-)
MMSRTQTVLLLRTIWTLGTACPMYNIFITEDIHAIFYTDPNPEVPCRNEVFNGEINIFDTLPSSILHFSDDEVEEPDISTSEPVNEEFLQSMDQEEDSPPDIPPKKSSPPKRKKNTKKTKKMPKMLSNPIRMKVSTITDLPSRKNILLIQKEYTFNCLDFHEQASTSKI